MSDFIAKLKLFVEYLKAGNYIQSLHVAGELIVKFSEVLKELSDAKVFALGPDQVEELEKLKDEIIQSPLPVEGPHTIWMHLIPLMIKIIEKLVNNLAERE